MSHLNPLDCYHASCSVDETSEASPVDSGLAQTQLIDGEGSNSADCALKVPWKWPRVRVLTQPKGTGISQGGQENLARVC